MLPFVNAAKTLLDSAKNVLPEADKPKVDTALEVVGVISSFPTPEQIKAEVIALVDQVAALIATLRAP